jgi:hypothetical protein
MWVSVTDNLPPTHADYCYDAVSDEVLCLFRDGTKRVCQLTVWEDAAPTWRTCDSEGWNVSRQIAFWMCLPELPKEFVGGVLGK